MKDTRSYLDKVRYRVEYRPDLYLTVEEAKAQRDLAGLGDQPDFYRILKVVTKQTAVPE